MKNTKMCYECKEQFNKLELIDYASPKAKTMHSYCRSCLKKKQARDAFSDKICMIFGLKTPGPRIWTERKRLQETYGYTDQTITECLEYIYNIEKKKKLAESLTLVRPQMVNKMEAYKRQQDYNGAKIAQSIAATRQEEHVVPIRENNNRVSRCNWDPDQFLDFD